MALATMLGLAAVHSLAQAQTFTVIYSFKGGTDGASASGIVRDAAGIFYGTTYYGGDLTCGGCGTIFKLSPTGKEKVLHSFTGVPDGTAPAFGLISDPAGNHYGTAQQGGTSNGGVVFMLDTTGKETILHSFAGAPDGANPVGGLVRDSQGNLYGTTEAGGESTCPWTCGTVFKIDAAGSETILHSFNGYDGQFPESGVILDAAGNLFGTAETGGGSGYGTVFKVDAVTGEETVLHAFSGGADGIGPWAGLVLDGTDLYGATSIGGRFNDGTVFKVDATGKETVLHNFAGGADGVEPLSSLIHDAAGKLYGTTFYGGAFGQGIVFKLDTTGKETVLHTFTGGADGANPSGRLIQDAAGNLYGGTNGGGAFGRGVVFKIVP